MLSRYRDVRRFTERLAEPLEIEDQIVQSMPDASPTKWHLAHTTWFFEAFILRPHLTGYVSPNDTFHYLFNSYYNSFGEQFTRADRGLVTRPTVAEATAFRRHVDAAVERLLTGADRATLDAVLPLVEVGLHHEQQHQELIITDLKHLLSRNPLHPVYLPAKPGPTQVAELERHAFDEGLYRIGRDPSEDGFAFDNESPRHRIFLEAFEIASRPVTSGEYIEFLNDGGYERPEWWLSEGWTTVREQGWRAPLYWFQDGGAWWQHTLAGKRPVEAHEPVCHVSHFEADAYARWAGARLPSEAEWELAAVQLCPDGVDAADNLAEDGHFHPIAARDPRRGQWLGDVWEWTRSPYLSYPGYRAPEGALGEYNAKFMSNQMVLRGGSCVTPRSHLRATYRNFFPSTTRWQFSGFRLAWDGASA